MKNLFPLFLLIAFASCGEKGSSETTEAINVLEDLTYTVDTVVVDSGEDFLSIQNEFQLESSSSMSDDKRLFYLFNNENHTIAVVDLDQLRLLEFLSFEKEGPNGVGQYVQGIQALADQKFLISNFQASGIFDSKGNKLENYKLEAAEFEGLNITSPFSSQLLMTSDGKSLFSLTGFYNQGAKDLARLDPNQKTGEVIDLPELDIANDFSINLQSKDGTMTSVPQSIIQDINGKLYVTNEVTSSVYRYDYKADSLELLTFLHQLVPSAKSGSLKNKVSSRDELFAEMEKSTTQTGFKKLLWDETRQRFFRLGSKIIPSTIESDDSYKSDVYLFIYDADLHLLGEKLLENLSVYPRFYFLKDGKLWSYVNVEDELGFAVFTFNF